MLRAMLHTTGGAGRLTEVTSQDWMLVLPELILLLGAMLIPFVHKLVKDVRARQELALLFIALALASTIMMMIPGGPALLGFGPEANMVFIGALQVDAFSLFFKLIFLLVALIVVLVSPTSVKPASRNTEYYTLLLIATLGMLVVAGARDLLTIFVGLETAALSSYVLAGYRKGDLESTEAATKFVIIGALASSLTLYGLSLVYAAAGTLDLVTIGQRVATGEGTNATLLAVAFLVAGFGFKVTTVPFHMWAPDVYQGSPSPVSGLLAAGSKKMGLAAFFKVFFVGLLAAKAQWDLLVGVLAVATMTVGNLMALRQDSVKRLLAWSSVGQAGYMLIAFPVGTQLALAGAFFHALTHAVMKGGAFAIAAVLAARGIGDKISDWAGLRHRAPVHAFTMTVLLISMAGIPPLAGFASKFVLFSSAIDAGIARENNWLIFLAVAGILNSVVSLAYYARLARAMYIDEAPEGSATTLLAYRAPVWVAMFLILAGTLIMGIWPEPFVEMSLDAAASLLSP